MATLPPAAPDLAAGDLRRFCEHFGVPEDASGVVQLEAVARAFTRIPYENLTKIIRDARSEGQTIGRTPSEVITEHLRDGTGGTCFSLTAALASVLRALGWRVDPLLADRWYGENTHSALLVHVAGAPCIIDPGYLIQRPVRVGDGRETRLRGPAGDTVLRPVGDGSRVELWTERGGSRSHRLTYKAAPADSADFLRAWAASFEWDMMRYPVLTRFDGEQHVYLQGNRLQVRDSEHTERVELPPAELARRITRAFGVAPHVIRAALGILRDRGELGD